MNTDIYTQLFGDPGDKNQNTPLHRSNMHNLNRQSSTCSQQEDKKPYIKTEKTMENASDHNSELSNSSTVHSINSCYTNGGIHDKHYDSAYWEKRRRNNESAKRSRDSRRLKEEQLALRVVYLEQENLQLHTEVSILKSEIERMRCMLYEPVRGYSE